MTYISFKEVHTHISIDRLQEYILYYYVKIKLSLYRPGQAFGVPGV